MDEEAAPAAGGFGGEAGQGPLAELEVKFPDRAQQEGVGPLPSEGGHGDGERPFLRRRAIEEAAEEGRLHEGEVRAEQEGGAGAARQRGAQPPLRGRILPLGVRLQDGLDPSLGGELRRLWAAADGEGGGDGARRGERLGGAGGSETAPLGGGEDGAQARLRPPRVLDQDDDPGHTSHSPDFTGRGTAHGFG